MKKPEKELTKYMFVSNIAAPYQIKFCYSLQKYFNAEFYFYEYIDETRPEWWKIDLGPKCKILKDTKKISKFGYFSWKIFYEIFKFKPKIIVLGGFMKLHIFILYFAKLLGAKVAIMSEPVRYLQNDDEGTIELINKKNSLYKIKLLKLFFKSVDLYIGMGEIAKKQFIEEFEFPEEKTIKLIYPQDIEKYYNHSLRIKKKGDDIVLLFANRLVERYQPLMALKIFKKLSIKYKNLKLLMNAEGSQKKECIKYIKENNLKNIEFLEEIKSWDDLNLVYEKADILLLPGMYSNGNGTIIEACASGMGLVLSDQINNIETHAKHNINCFICNLNIESFVNAISKYIDNPELLEEHGKKSREFVRFRRNSVLAKKYFDIFREYNFIKE